LKNGGPGFLFLPEPPIYLFIIMIISIYAFCIEDGTRNIPTRLYPPQFP
jgi:hypothetical protein